MMYKYREKEYVAVLDRRRWKMEAHVYTPETWDLMSPAGDVVAAPRSEITWSGDCHRCGEHLAERACTLPMFNLCDECFSRAVDVMAAHTPAEVLAWKCPGIDEDELNELAPEESDAMQELEHYIEDWYWDEPSHEFARQVGALLFRFMDYLETTGLPERTINKHISNCWLIGKLECDYGYHDTFSPKIFAREPSFLYEFKRKVSDSKYDVDSYKATWRKLARYVRSLGYED